ncbi:MAG: hypothetical protein HYT79_04275 [Elusimicrobia bacterium]|nr:hypothetical protein [Elusimicrobiota bacterium]
MIGLFKPWILGLLAMLSIAFCRRQMTAWIGEIRRSIGALAQEIKNEYRDKQAVYIGALIMISIALAITFAIASHAPAVYRDDLSYHLYLPKAYLEMGRIAPVPFHQAQSYYPHLFNISYIPALAFGGELAAKMMNFCWSLVLAGLGICLALRAGASALTACTAGAAVLATPLVGEMSQTALADLPAACFALGGLLALLAYQNKTPAPVAILSALALNKYTSWSFPLATAMIFAWQTRNNARFLFRGVFQFALFSMTALLPLCAYLWWTMGSPFYPLPFLNGFPYDSLEKANLAATTINRNPAMLLSYCWERFLSGGGLDGGAYLAFCPLILLWPDLLKGKTGRIALWLALALAIRFFAGGQSQLIWRYILPVYAAGAVLGILVWGRALGEWPKRRWMLRLMLAAQLIVPGLTAMAMSALPQAFYNAGRLSGSDFLDRYYPNEGWEMLLTVNHLPPQSRTAVIDHHATPYHYKDLGRHLWQVPHEILLQDDPLRIAEALKREQITHVLFIHSQWERTRTPNGVLWNAVYFAPYIQCRWWTNKRLDFLKSVSWTWGAVLFKIEPAIGRL